MTEKEQVIRAIRATLISVKGALTIKQCNRDYRELQGEWIPFRRLGYDSLEKLFLEVPGFKVSERNGEFYVDAIASQATQHIVEMVAKQKNNKRVIPKQFNKTRFPYNPNSWRKPFTSSATYNNQYSNKFYNSYSSSYGYKDNFKSKAKAPEPKPQIKMTSKPSAFVNKDNKPSTSKATVKSTVTRVHSNNENKPPENKQVNGKENVKQMTRSVSAPETKPPKMSASQRLSILREHLNSIPLSLPAISNEVTVDIPETQENARAEVVPLELPPETDSTVVKLEWTCKKLGLPHPTYKVIPQRGMFYCQIKVEPYSASSYPESSAKEELAKELAAVKLLSCIESSEVAGLPTSNNDHSLSNLTELIGEHTGGLWVNTIPHLYREKFNENLPVNWQELIEKCPYLVKDRVLNGFIVLLQKDQIQYLPSDTFEDNNSDLDLPLLQFPENSFWSVHVTVANSSLEVWLRLVGTNYSETLKELQDEMLNYYTNFGTPVDNLSIVKHAWYAVQLDDGWQRAKYLDMEDEYATVFLGDHGDVESVSLSQLRILEPQFRRLAAQAILCRLEGIEELAAFPLACAIVQKRLFNEVLVAAPGPRDDLLEPTISVVLYDTSTSRDINLNNEIMLDFCSRSSITFTTHDLVEVNVPCVTDEGRAWVCAPGGVSLISKALQLLMSPGPFRRQLPASPLAPSPDQHVLYIVRTMEGDWVRCKIISGLDGEGTVRTQLVDNSLVLRAPLSSLMPLKTFSEALNAYPPQAIQVSLAGGPLWPGAIDRLRELLVGKVALCRAGPNFVATTIPKVDMFMRIGEQQLLASVYNAIIMEQQYKPKEVENTHIEHVEELHRKKERIFMRNASNALAGVDENAPRLTFTPRCRTLPAQELPTPGTFFDVFVAMAANPCNFVVQPNKSRHALVSMMASLQQECPKLTEDSAPRKPACGDLYTAYYAKDNSWYRVIVAHVVSSDVVSVYFCDFGDLGLVPINTLRPVPPNAVNAMDLPPQAIRAQLYDVSPLHQDWNVEDCIRFQQLCVEQEFVGICKAIGKDPLNKNEPILTLDLIDTSTEEDLYLNKQFVEEGHARLTSSLSQE